MARSSQVVAGILLTPYVACGVALCLLILDRPHCDSTYYFSGSADPEGGGGGGDAAAPADEAGLVADNSDAVLQPQKYLDQRYCAGGYHGLLCVIGTLLMGFTIIIYRLLIGTRTRTVKYIHLLLHLITLSLFVASFWCVEYHMHNIFYYRFEIHTVTSLVVFLIFLIQFIVAAMIFTYLYPNTKLRLYFAPFHDILGIWLFICFVSCLISGKRYAQMDYVASNQILFYGLSYAAFTFILIVILSPFFEWDMVGPL
ncbi:uncharacterized protein LOC101898276 [Musca domestica]|uniref:Probable ascorbate-specific transmembrane electron transporter 1 n=1 Tax=Musca domestica TaxID=7370 RepID=A0A1I8MXE4_MUSDO|nr:uncharacterized protein LOC101898276 [Musca domestica]